MSKSIQLNASLRSTAGKGSARAERRADKIPAVIYGDNKEPVMVSILEKDLIKEIRAGGFLTKITDVKVGNDKHHVLARDVQFHPVTDRPLHVDFLRVSDKTKINVFVHTSFINEEAAPGIKRGGVLNVVFHEVELWCAANSIPETVEIDLTGLEVGDSIHFHDIKLPAGVEFSSEENLTLCTIVAPSALVSEDNAAAAEGDAAAAPAATEAKKEG